MPKKSRKIDYPRIRSLEIPIQTEPIPHILWSDLKAGIIRAGISEEKFNKYLDGQTCLHTGPYPWDIESIFERIIGKRLTGTQLYWD